MAILRKSLYSKCSSTRRRSSDDEEIYFYSDDDSLDDDSLRFDAFLLFTTRREATTTNNLTFTYRCTPTGSGVKKRRQESYSQPFTSLLQTMSKQSSLKNLLGLSKKKAPPGGEDKEEEEEEEQQQQNTAGASEHTLNAKHKTRKRTGARGEGEGVLETKERWNRFGNKSGARGEEERGRRTTSDEEDGKPGAFAVDGPGHVDGIWVEGESEQGLTAPDEVPLAATLEDSTPHIPDEMLVDQDRELERDEAARQRDEALRLLVELQEEHEKARRKFRCFPYGGLHAISVTVAGFATLFTWLSTLSCPFFNVSSAFDIDLGFGGTGGLTNDTDLGVGLWYIKGEDDSCVEKYPESIRIDGAMNFARAMGVLSVIAGTIVFILILIPSCFSFGERPYMKVMAGCFFTLSMATILIMVRSESQAAYILFTQGRPLTFIVSKGCHGVQHLPGRCSMRAGI
jgi:hypothetical protein